MLYIVRVYEGTDVFEYEYGNLKHAQEHMSFERCYAELYEWQNQAETFICSVNSNIRKRIQSLRGEIAAENAANA